MNDGPDAARYRVLFETTPDGIMIVDDAGIYVDLNDAMCRLLRGRREELLGRHFSEFMPADRLEEAVGAFAGLQSGAALAMELPIRAVDGAIVNLEWRSRANFVPGLHFCIARDLSARDTAERALSDSDDRYRAFVANSSEAIWRFELEEPVSIHLAPDEQIDLCYRYGYLAECNEAMARMYGFSSPEEIVGARLGDLVVRDNPENIAFLRAFIESGYRLVGAESREVDRDGKAKYFVNNFIGVLENDSILRAWGTQRDVTEQHRLLQRLEFLADVTAVLGSSLDYDLTLRAVAEAAVPRFADWCFISVLNERGEVVRVAIKHANPRHVDLFIEMEQRYPLSPDLPVGPPHTIRTGATQSFEVDEAMFARVAQSGEHLQTMRTLGFRRGVVVPLAAHGRTLGALSFANAETDRRFTEDDVQFAEDLGRRAGLAIENAGLYRELERANRAKDEFLAMLSHELRTPMTATLGWAAMMQSGGLPEDGVRTAIDAIAQSTRAQARLIDDLLDVSRIVAGKLRLTVQRFALAEAIEAAVDTVRSAADAKQILLQVDLRDPGVHLNGDAARLQQVFWNLLSNAVKFSPRFGKVYVELTRSHDSARVVVGDAGEGIDPALLPFIFDRFRQGDTGMTRRFGGLGLGLSIARNLVELHGGTLSARSEGRGTGAEFSVTLPLSSEQREVPHEAERDEPPPPLAGLKLLVVDDDESTRRMLQVALGQFGADVIAASSAAEAFDKLSRQKFDVLVSDIGMPGEDGCGLMRRVRTAGNPIGAVALTAYANEGERDRALTAGFQAWLTKPIDPAVLAEEVRRVAR